MFRYLNQVLLPVAGPPARPTLQGMDPHTVAFLVRERQQQLIDEAARERLARSLPPGQPRRRPLASLALVLGRIRRRPTAARAEVGELGVRPAT